VLELPATAFNSLTGGILIVVFLQSVCNKRELCGEDNKMWSELERLKA